MHCGASVLSRGARSDADVVARQLDFATPKRGTLVIPCVGEFKNGGGGFYDQESRSKHPMLFRVLPFAFIRFCANFRGRE